MTKVIKATDWTLIDFQNPNSYPPLDMKETETLMMAEPDEDMGYWWIVFPSTEIINERIDRVSGQYWVIIEMPFNFPDQKVFDISIG